MKSNFFSRTSVAEDKGKDSVVGEIKPDVPVNSTTESVVRPVRRGQGHVITGPSALYRAEFWRLGVFMARRLPHFILGRTASNLAKLYWLGCPNRRRVGVGNLLPLVHGDRLAAGVSPPALVSSVPLQPGRLWGFPNR